MTGHSLQIIRKLGTEAWLETNDHGRFLIDNDPEQGIGGVRLKEFKCLWVTRRSFAEPR
jgi:hypothetical protein